MPAGASRLCMHSLTKLALHTLKLSYSNQDLICLSSHRAELSSCTRVWHAHCAILSCCCSLWVDQMGKHSPCVLTATTIRLKEQPGRSASMSCLSYESTASCSANNFSQLFKVDLCLGAQLRLIACCSTRLIADCASYALQVLIKELMLSLLSLHMCHVAKLVLFNRQIRTTTFCVSCGAQGEI